MAFVPDTFKTPMAVYLVSLILLGDIIVRDTETSYIIISQRMQLGMSVVTPYEIDLMEDLCILGKSPLKKMLYNTKLICTTEIKEFFYARLDKKSP